MGRTESARETRAKAGNGAQSTPASAERRVKEPRSSLGPRQFDIWWASLPEPVGRRPILLLGRSASFAYLTRVLVVEVTTTIRNIPQEVLLGASEGLRKACVANLDTLRSLPRDRLDLRIGSLHPSRHAEVKRALGHVLHWPELTGL